MYPLLNNNFYKGCVTSLDGMTTDDRWHIVTNFTKLDLVNWNPELKEIINKLPEYNIEGLSKEYFQLFGRHYIEWGKRCEDNP